MFDSAPLLKQRFTQAQILQICNTAGLVDLRFSLRTHCLRVVRFKADTLCAVSQVSVPLQSMRHQILL